MSPESVIVLSRLGLYPASIFVFGTGLFLVVVASRELSGSIGRRLRPALVAASLIAAISTLIWLPAEAAIAGDGWRSVLDPELLRTLLLQTSVGKIWMARMLLALAGVLATSLLDHRPGLVMLVAGGFLASAAFAGHAVMSEGATGWLHIGNDVVHLLSGGAWVGSLVPLALSLARGADRTCRHDLMRLLGRFSAMGHLCVALVAMTGVVNTLLIIGGWPLHWSSPYQAMLSAKIFLVVLMIGLALRNRYSLTPRVEAGDGGALMSLRRAAWTEAGLSVAVLALVAVFGVMAPG